MLPRKMGAAQSDTERAKWQIVRLDDPSVVLSGLILEADADAGTAKMRERGPDNIAEDGTRTPTYTEVVYSLGADSIAIVRR